MLKPTFLLVMFACKALSQPYYTPIRASIGAEAFGVSPKGQVYAEATFLNRKKSFCNVSAGFGAIWQADFKSYTFSSSLTYAYLLNPYRRKPCQPHPGYNGFESYLDAGVATFFADTYDAKKNISGIDDQRLLTPLALAGLRIHIIGRKWIYIIKIRCTPALLENKFASKAGVALALGWR